MTIKYDDIRAHVEAGKTAAEIAPLLATDPLHVRDVTVISSDDSPDLQDVLVIEFEVLSPRENNHWVGSLVTAIAAFDENDPRTKGFHKLLALMRTPGKVVHCSANPESGQLIGMLTTLVAGLVSTNGGDKTGDDVRAAMNKLTGGRRYAGVTASQVQAVIDQEARDRAMQELSARMDRVLIAANEAERRQGSTAEQITAAAESAWEA